MSAKQVLERMLASESYTDITKIKRGDLTGQSLNNIQEKIGLKLPGTTISVPTGILPTHTIKDFLKYNLPEP